MKKFLIILAVTWGLLSSAIVADDKAKTSSTQTKGWVNGKYVQLKSKTNKRGETTTTGWIDGKRVRLKTKEKKR